jgi:hypothetical protein
MAFTLDTDCLSLSRLLVRSGSDTEPWSPSPAEEAKSGMGSSPLAKASAVYSSMWRSGGGFHEGGLQRASDQHSAALGVEGRQMVL